jgi:PPOX class probable F420-dependent enzyme
MPIPHEISQQRYISLITFRKNGVPVPTPVWFGEQNDRLYVMTRTISGKYKRIRNNPQVKIAPCTIRGKVTGPEFAATARILPQNDWPMARKTITDKYLLARLSSPWSKADAFFEIEV